MSANQKYSCDICNRKDENDENIQKCLCLYKSHVTPLIKKVINAKRKKYQHESTIFGDNSQENIEKLSIAHDIRQKQMKEGIIAQICIGNFYGWTNLQTNSSGLDCKKNDNSIIMELKNKYNTCNSGSQKAVLDKLALYKQNNPNTLCVWSIVNPKPKSKLTTETISHNGVEIKKIQGTDLFKLVFTYNDHDYSQEVIDYIKTIMYD